MTTPKLSPILSTLQQKGYRLTRTRKQIINIFESNHNPMSALEINTFLKSGGTIINKSTLYREIEFLVDQKILNTIQLQEKTKRYELTHLDHHHHLICQKCHQITDFDIENCLVDLLNKVSIDKQFMIKDHILDLYGLCVKCKN